MDRTALPEPSPFSQNEVLHQRIFGHQTNHDSYLENPASSWAELDDYIVKMCNEMSFKASANVESLVQNNQNAFLANNCKNYVEELQREVLELKRDKKETEKQMENLKAEKENLISQLNDKTLELCDLKENLTNGYESVSNLKQLVKQKSELKEENEALKLELDVEHDNNAQVQANWKKASKQMISKYFLEIKKVTSQRNSQTAKIYELQKNFEEMKKMYELEKNERQKLQARYIALEIQTATEKAELDGTRRDPTFGLTGSFSLNLPSTSGGSVGESNSTGLKRVLFQQSREDSTHKRGRPTGGGELETCEDTGADDKVIIISDSE